MNVLLLLGLLITAFAAVLAMRPTSNPALETDRRVTGGVGDRG
ncbi:hypothetical protein [Rhodococcus opacus]|nr:hypothetical protein [Rhodococcus opacus]